MSDPDEETILRLLAENERLRDENTELREWYKALSGHAWEDECLAEDSE